MNSLIKLIKDNIFYINSFKLERNCSVFVVKMNKSFVIVLLLIEISLKSSAQIPTVPTASPTDPTTTTVFTIPTPSTITAGTTVPTPPTIISTSSSSFVETTSTSFVTTSTNLETSSTNYLTTSTPSFIPMPCPPEGLHHLPTENCQYFIVCVWGNPHEGNCNDGFLFDPSTSSCLPANNVDCGTRYRP